MVEREHSCLNRDLMNIHHLRSGGSGIGVFPSNEVRQFLLRVFELLLTRDTINIPTYLFISDELKMSRFGGGGGRGNERWGS